MYIISFYSVIRISLSVSILFLGRQLTHNTTVDKEKSSPFECGFDPSGNSQLHFCIKFFLIGVIFLIFDVEVTLIIPLPFRQSFIVVFVTLLILGLAYE